MLCPDSLKIPNFKFPIKYFLIIISFILPGCSSQLTLPSFYTTETINLNDPCWQHTLNAYGTTSQTMKWMLDKEIANYQSLVEQSLTHRIKAINIAQRLKNNINQNKPLSGYDLDMLNRGGIAHLQLRHKLYNVALLHECWLNIPTDTFFKLGIEQISPENQLKGVMLSLSAALMLYDNYLLAISIFEEDDKLRRFLNQRDSGYAIGQNELTQITKSYHSSMKRKRVKNALNFYENRMAKISHALSNDSNFNYLKLLIKQSPSYNMTKKYSPLYAINKKLHFLGAISRDILHHFALERLNLFSQFFGDSVGLIETRKGKLYDRIDVLEIINHKLRAGDILLEKTPFRLTDKFIPGHWGHAAIWIGTENELKSLGIWDHPLVTMYHEQIRKGHTIVEALRPGVQMNPLQPFLNVDDLAILRKPNLERETLTSRILLALRQIGKEYDFNFDVETTDRIVCSELIYAVFIGIEWPTKKTLGRFTISPDNVASKALNGGPLKLIAFFNDGKFVTHRPLELMVQLMNGK